MQDQVPGPQILGIAQMQLGFNAFQRGAGDQGGLERSDGAQQGKQRFTRYTKRQAEFEAFCAFINADRAIQAGLDQAVAQGAGAVGKGGHDAEFHGSS